MKNSNLSKRIAFKIILVVVIIQIFLLILYQKREDFILDRYINEITHNAEFLVDRTFRDNLKELADYIETIPYIYYIKVLDKNGNVAIARYRGSSEKTMNDIVTKEIVLESNKAGYTSIIIAFSRNSIYRHLGKYSSWIIVLNLVFIIITISIISILFKKEMGQRFHNFMDLIEKISVGNLKVIPKTDDQTEFGQVQKKLKLLVDNLVSIIKKIRALTKNVSAAINQLKVISRDIISKMEKQHNRCKAFTITIEDVSEKQKGITKNTEKLIGLSDKNLTSAIEIKNTSEEIFKTMDELNKQLTDTLNSVTELSKSAKEISSLSDRSNSKTLDVSTSIDEIIKTTKEIESLAADSLAMSEETTRIIIEKGIFSTADAVEEMEDIEDSVKGLMETINTFEERSKDIEKILSVIKDITEQTGLLSLNAQILAVQAGEYGKSFSVVADEMKVLSEKTSSSTKEIAKIISTLKSEMKDLVLETKNVVAMIGSGHEKVARTAEALNEIHTSSKKATHMSKQIVNATKEQTRGIESITTAIEHIKKLTWEIKKATSEQDKDLSLILKSIEKIKDISSLITRTTGEQFENNNYIVQNIESVNQIISWIASASKEQQDVNTELVSVLNELMDSNSDIIRDIREQTLLLNSLIDEVELLRKELLTFQIEDEGR